MQAFEIIVTRDTTESRVVQIHAANEEEAKLQALTETADSYDWTQDDTPNASKVRYITGCEPVS